MAGERKGASRVPILARPFAQEPALSEAEGVGFHSRRPLGIFSSHVTENQETSPMFPCGEPTAISYQTIAAYRTASLAKRDWLRSHYGT
jgi:hypothetical protein